MPKVLTFDIDHASDAEFQHALEYSNTIRTEMFPDDPPRTLETLKKSWKAMMQFEKERNTCWVVMQNQQHLAHLWTHVGHYDDNKHLMHIELTVHPKYRRQGLAKQLLSYALRAAEENQRTHILSSSPSTIPSGNVFAQRVGAKLGLEGHTNQLKLSELDLDLIAKWKQPDKQTASDFSLDFWLGDYPEDEIADIARMISVMNTAPRGDLKIEDWEVKPEDLREGETYSKQVGIERWVAYVRHNQSGELAGYTAVFYQRKQNIWVVNQGDTAVVPKYRGHGLGKWLKSTMLEKILRERPEVKFIRTGNADSNAPMLAINHALGFKPYIGWTDWQIETQQLKHYLAVR